MEAVLASFQQIIGPAHVLAGADLAPYLVEERGLYQGTALCALKPATTEQVAQCVTLCAQNGIAVVPAGGRTGLVGGTIAHGRAIILSLERMNKIIEVDAVNYTMIVEAGCVLANLQNAALAHDRLFPLSLGSEGSCQIGGNISTNAGGINVVRYGNTRDLVLGLEVVLPDGRIWDGLKSLRKDNTGLDLKHLFIGAEGTLGLITRACLKLFPRPKSLQTALFALSELEAAPQLLALARDISADRVQASELISRFGLELTLAHIANVRDPMDRPHDWYLLIDIASSAQEDLKAVMEQLAQSALEAGLIQDAVLAQSQTQSQNLWRIRETIPEAQKHEGGSIKHDVSVPVAKVPQFITKATQAVQEALPGIRPCPFGHVGDGNIHFNLTQPKGADKAAFLAHWGQMNRIVHDMVLDLNGSISAEHGIGLVKRDELRRTASATELDLQKRVKLALDPLGIMNPGKIIDLPKIRVKDQPED